MSKLIELLENQLIPLQEEKQAIIQSFPPSQAGYRGGDYAITDGSHQTDRRCPKRCGRFDGGNRSCYEHRCDGGDVLNINNSARAFNEKRNREMQQATAGVNSQIASLEKEILELKEKAQLPILRKQIIGNSQELDRLEQKYNLFTQRPTLEELKPSTKPAQPLADQLIQKPETQPAQPQPISISLAIPQTNNKNLIIAGSVGFLVILIIILVMRFRK
jgi:hypothetical protein